MPLRLSGRALVLGVLGAALCPSALVAQDINFEQLRARDRLAPPAEELAVWETYADTVFGSAAAIQPLQLAETHLGLAIAHYYTRQNELAWADVAAAEAQLAQIDESPIFHAELLAYASMILVELGRTDEASDYAARALTMAESGGEIGLRNHALALNAVGFLAFAENDLIAAEEAFCTARDLGLRAPDPYHAMIVNDASSCGAIKYYLERPDTIAAIRLARDYAFAHLPPDHPKMGNVLNTSYGALLRSGRYGEALPLIRRHLELERGLRGDDHPYVYDALSMLGRTLELLGQMEDAEGIFRAASSVADQARDQSQPYTAGISLTNLASTIARQGRPQEAEQIARQGLARLRADLEPTDYHIGSAAVHLADHLARLGRGTEALALADEGLALLEQELPEGHSEILGARLIRAGILSGLGNHAAALDQSRPIAAMLGERLLDLSASEAELVSLSETLPEALADHLLVTLRAGEMEEAVQAAQLRLLSELTVTNARMRAGAQARDDALDAMVRQLDAEQAQLAALSAQLNQAQGEGASGEALTQLSGELAQARAQVAATQAALEQAYPAFVALARPQPATLAQLQASLGPDELLVLPQALPDRVITIVISRQTAEWAESPMTGYAAQQLAARLRSSAEQTGHFDSEAAAQIFDVLFPPELRPLLAQKSQLLFPASGYLARISPAMLLTAAYDGDDLSDAPWLIRSHSVEVLADLGGLSARRTRAENLTSGGFLGVGAPSSIAQNLSEEQLPPLPQARAELLALGQQLTRALDGGEALILTGADASEAALTALDLESFSVIAFATHGLLGGEIEGLSEPALLMTPAGGGASGDGLLTASEISMLTINADWVILSACETAGGTTAGAPGYSGLARAFVQAGARSLLLSHWRVRDDAAAFLSVETMRLAVSGRNAAGGNRRSQALRQAQLALMARSDIPGAAHPAIWAPFVILEN